MAFSIADRKLTPYLVIGCLAAATLGFELVQTRVLSALYYNHVVYLTVTIALMGFGISGVLVSLFLKDSFDRQNIIVIASALFAVTMVVCMYTVSHLPQWYPGAMMYNKLLVSYFLLMVPFLCSGTAIGLILMGAGPNVFKLYFFDLVASALACIAFTMLLTPLGAARFIWCCVGLACIAIAVQARNIRSKSAFGAGFFLIMAGLYGYYGNAVVGRQPENYKTLYRAFVDRSNTIEATKWTPITRIDLVSNPYRMYVTNDAVRDGVNYKLITQDSDAFTIMPNSEMVQKVLNAAGAGKAGGSTLNLLYLMRPKTEESLVIGVGGGIDMIRSHAYGAAHTTGVEINPETIALDKKNADYTVWPKWPDIDLVVEEGRHFIRSHTNAYDTITMSGIDTFSALNSGAYVLSENYLYTTEAFEDYLNALKPDGTMAIFRWLETVPPRESLRLASLYMEAAARMGIKNPEQCILVIADNLGWMRWASTFIKKTPFTQDEIDVVLRHLPINDRFAALYVPSIYPPQQQKEIEGGLFSVQKHLEPVRAAYRQVINPASPEKKANFFKTYRYDVTPVYDDRPFFFEYHKGGSMSRWTSGVHTIRSANAQNGLHMLLFVTTIVSLWAMIGPLVIFNAKGMKTPGFIWLFMYFSCLGIGFMLVEIGMMQRLSLYLGDPMRSLSVVLSSLLLSAGIGSYLSPGISSDRKRFACGTLGTSAVVLLWLLVIPQLIAYTQGAPYFVRVLLTVISFLPTGIVMGIPFASGLNLVGSHSPRIVPWAWGINGLTSVLASILAIMLAMRLGFTAVLAIGACVYFLGFVAISIYMHRVQKV